jgi:hypothetical protein
MGVEGQGNSSTYWYSTVFDASGARREGHCPKILLMSSQTTQQTTAMRCALGKGCPGTGWHLNQSATEAYHRSLAAAGLPAVNTDPLGDVRLRPWQSAELGTAEPGTLFSADRASSGLSNVSVSRGEESLTLLVVAFDGTAEGVEALCGPGVFCRISTYKGTRYYLTEAGISSAAEVVTEAVEQSSLGPLCTATRVENWHGNYPGFALLVQADVDASFGKLPLGEIFDSFAAPFYETVAALF